MPSAFFMQPADTLSLGGKRCLSREVSIVRLSQETLNSVYQHASAAYPSECCGIITGRNEIQQVHACKNLQDELHARDPENHPRTSREAYAMDRDEAERIMRDASARNESVLAFYHSHIDCGAYFSRMDKDVQTVFGEPEFPDAVHVVVSVVGGNINEIKGYCWDGKNQDFVTINVV
jgi:[CysO sulfur-carrier protein]-S-L-cysteine hydrolase